MSEMRQLTFVEAGRVEWQEAAEPRLTGADGAIVRPLAVARCDLDQPMALQGLFPGPFAVGHEVAARIVSVGDGVTRRRVGEAVIVPFQVSCGACQACRAGRFAGCETHRASIGASFGFGSSGGGYGGAVADLLAVPAADHLLLPLPDGLDPVVACTLPDNVVDAYRTVGPHVEAFVGAEVLVVGGWAPSVGLYAVAVAAALGLAVRYVDGDAVRCAAAERLGATVELHRGSWPKRFERAMITVDNTGTEEGLATTLRSTGRYGVCTSVAIHFSPSTAVPLSEMYTRGATLHVSRADSRRHLPAVMALLAAGKLDPLSVPTSVVPWDVADQAWLEPATKLVLRRASDR
jgi:threonine dehydrogenase-like Zn-dependent dehydrogenase